MPNFTIRVVNCDYESASEIDSHDIGRARDQGMRAALGMGTDELCKGTSFFGAEVRLEIDGQVKERMMIAMGATPLR